MNERIIDEKYWIETMKHRQKEYCEVERLISIAQGFYLSDLKYESECNEKNVIDLENYDLLYFVKNSKGPFGNKNKEQSIMFNLGWDRDRRLVYQDEPQWVIDESNRIYRLVIKELEKRQE